MRFNTLEPIKFSVLMCVHRGENPQHLNLCLESINSQKLPPDETVLVKDGRLTPGLEETIGRWKTIFGNKLKTVGLRENIGFAGALNEGLKHCAFDRVARMDTDDIACPERFREQITFIEKNPGFDVVGAWIDEYDEKMLRRTGCRKVPELHEDIIRFARWRSPLNHMSVIYRKEAVLSSGGYPEELIKMQDYGLWAKLILAGCRFHNIPKPLVMVRAGAPLLARRGGLRYCMMELKLLAFLRRIGFQDPWHLLANGAVRTAVRLMPPALRSAVYRLLRH